MNVVLVKQPSKFMHIKTHDYGITKFYNLDVPTGFFKKILMTFHVIKYIWSK